MSIVAGIASLLKITYTIGAELKQFHDGVVIVNRTIADLQRDVASLKDVLGSIRSTVADITAEVDTRRIASHFDNIARTIEDGTALLVDLHATIQKLGKETAFLNGPRKQLRVNLAAERIQVLRDHVRTYLAGLQLSMTTIILANQTWYHKSTDRDRAGGRCSGAFTRAVH